MISKLRKLEKKFKLSPAHKILLTTDGSITRILEALSGGAVSIETMAQRVVRAGAVAKVLRVKKEDEVNYRVVNIRSSGRVLAHAISHTPLKRLKREFRGDIMKKDVPIGVIMSRLKIEARREIRNFGVLRANEDAAKIFGIPKGSLVLKRNYNIIHTGRVLMNITEIFPYGTFE